MQEIISRLIASTDIVDEKSAWNTLGIRLESNFNLSGKSFSDYRLIISIGGVDSIVARETRIKKDRG